MLDESFFAVAPYLARGWFKVGSRPVVPYEHNRRDKHGVIGALSQEQFHHLFAEPIDSAVFECFVRLLLEKHKKVLLVGDHASYHTSWALIGFYTQHSDRLKTVFLPSYSPELNPTELVWRETKKWLGMRCWKDTKELKKELIAAFKEPFARAKFYDYLVP